MKIDVHTPMLALVLLGSCGGVSSPPTAVDAPPTRYSVLKGCLDDPLATMTWQPCRGSDRCADVEVRNLRGCDVFHAPDDEGTWRLVVADDPSENLLAASWLEAAQTSMPAEFNDDYRRDAPRSLQDANRLYFETIVALAGRDSMPVESEMTLLIGAVFGYLRTVDRLEPALLPRSPNEADWSQLRYGRLLERFADIWYMGSYIVSEDSPLYGYQFAVAVLVFASYWSGEGGDPRAELKRIATSEGPMRHPALAVLNTVWSEPHTLSTAQVTKWQRGVCEWANALLNESPRPVVVTGYALKDQMVGLLPDGCFVSTLPSPTRTRLLNQRNDIREPVGGTGDGVRYFGHHQGANAGGDHPGSRTRCGLSRDHECRGDTTTADHAGVTRSR